MWCGQVLGGEEREGDPCPLPSQPFNHSGPEEDDRFRLPPPAGNGGRSRRRRCGAGWGEEAGWLPSHVVGGPGPALGGLEAEGSSNLLLSLLLGPCWVLWKARVGGWGAFLRDSPLASTDARQHHA